MSQRILVVDDELPVVALLREGLAPAGFEVEGAHSAAEALELVRERLFDAAIIDFMLPDLNGVMLHSRIRQFDPELALHTLFISGHSQTEDDLSYYSAVGGFIEKPFDLSEVVAAIRSLIGD